MAEKGWTVPRWPVAYGGGGPAETKAQIVSLIKDSAAEVTVATFPAAYKRRWGAPMVAAELGCKKLSDVLKEVFLHILEMLQP